MNTETAARRKINFKSLCKAKNDSLNLSYGGNYQLLGGNYRTVALLLKKNMAAGRITHIVKSVYDWCC